MAEVAQEFVDLANRLADASRPILRSYYRRKLDVDIKSDASPVTQADREAEAAIRKLINATFPYHGIFGEEFGKERADAEYVWVLDPLDGTRAFVTGRPTFGTLIALTRNGAPLLGLIDMPVLGDRWVGAVGRPTTLNSEPVQARPCAKLGDAYLSASIPLIMGFCTLKTPYTPSTWGCRLARSPMSPCTTSAPRAARAWALALDASRVRARTGQPAASRWRVTAPP